MTNRTFSPVSGWVRTTGCSESGYWAFITRRLSIGMAAAKDDSKLWLARRSSICCLIACGRRS
ncbi:hypothetical protein D3C83_293640 [compost metagenome]